eukprot:PhF_6_TR19062/c0_g1_i2/m.28020
MNPDIIDEDSEPSFLFEHLHEITQQYVQSPFFTWNPQVIPKPQQHDDDPKSRIQACLDPWSAFPRFREPSTFPFTIMLKKPKLIPYVYPRKMPIELKVLAAGVSNNSDGGIQFAMSSTVAKLFADPSQRVTPNQTIVVKRLPHSNIITLETFTPNETRDVNQVGYRLESICTGGDSGHWDNASQQYYAQVVRIGSFRVLSISEVDAVNAYQKSMIEIKSGNRKGDPLITLQCWLNGSVQFTKFTSRSFPNRREFYSMEILPVPSPTMEAGGKDPVMMQYMKRIEQWLQFLHKKCCEEVGVTEWTLVLPCKASRKRWKDEDEGNSLLHTVVN